MAALHSLEDIVRDKVENEQWTHARLSTYLQQLYPGERGFSVRSLVRFCQEKVIHKTPRLSGQELEELVADNVDKVGGHTSSYTCIALKLVHIHCRSGQRMVER